MLPLRRPLSRRTNGRTTYGHCEAALYLHVGEGHYGAVPFKNLDVVDTSGSCGMSYEKLSAIYLDRGSPLGVREAFLQLLASFSATGTTEFPYVREVPIHVQVTDGHLFQVSIPENSGYGGGSQLEPGGPSLSPYAAQDRFAECSSVRSEPFATACTTRGAKLQFRLQRAASELPARN